MVTEKNDFDFEDNSLSLPLWLGEHIPNHLAKSVLRIYCDDTKRITLSFYFSHQGTGTLLCQGVDCPKWDAQECEVLKDIISDGCVEGDMTTVRASLMSLPVTFLRESGPVVELSTPTNVNYTESDSPNACTPSISPLLCKTQGEGHCSNNASPPSPVSVTPELAQHIPTFSDCDESMNEQKEKVSSLKSTTAKPTPQKARCKRDRRKTLCPPQRIDKKIPEKLNSIEGSLESLMFSLTDHEANLTSKLEDVKVCIKNDLKQHIEHKVEYLNSTLETLTLMVSKLDVSLNTMSKENHSLKTSLGNLQSELKQIKKTQSVKNASTQCDLTTEDAPRNSNIEVMDDFQGEDPQSFQSCPELNHESKASPPLSENEPKSTSFPHFASLREHQEVCIEKGQETQTESNATNKVAGITVHNRFDVLSGPENDINLDSTSEHALSPKTKASGSEAPPSNSPVAPCCSLGSEQTPSPRQVLNDLTIPVKASSVLLGDSVIRHINPKKLETANDPLFKICVPGLTISDTIHWLHDLPTQDHVQTLIVHLGVNDCPAGPITAQDWQALIKACKRCFPSAYIAMSSIIPARGKHQLNNAIAPSNRNLYTACTSARVDMVDHHGSFVTRNGAPRQALYKDVTHPSARGTACIALKFKCVLPQAQRPRLDGPIMGSARETDRERQAPLLERTNTGNRIIKQRHPRMSPNPSNGFLTHGTPDLSSPDDFPSLNPQNRSQTTQNEHVQGQQAARHTSRQRETLNNPTNEFSSSIDNNISHVGSNVGFPHNTPVSAPFPIAPQLLYPGLMFNPAQSRYPVPYPYPIHGTQGVDPVLRQTQLPIGPSASNFLPPLLRYSSDFQSHLPSSAVNQCAQQLVNLASQLVSQREH